MSVSVYVLGESSEDDYNVSNGNFRRLMDLIGDPIPQDWDQYRRYEPGAQLEELRARVVFALEGIRAIPDLDSGRPPSQYIGGEELGASGVLVIDCGMSEGYYERRLTGLLEVIDRALEVGKSVVCS